VVPEDGVSQSGYERNLEIQMKAVKLPAPKTQYRFATPRRWTFDFCWPDRRIALEVEGGIWTKGRHTRGVGYEKDCEKYNEAALRGFAVLRVTTGMVKDGRALQVVERAIQASTGTAQ
jgi:very-short-patch-repair endonuclease